MRRPIWQCTLSVVLLLNGAVLRAQEDRPSPAEGTDLLGRTIADFTLKDYRGKTYSLADDAGKKRMLALRPEAIVLEAPAAGRNSLTATVEEVNFLGAIVRIRTRVKDEVISLDIFNDPNRRLPERGQPVALGFSHENLLVLEEGAAS